MSLPDAPPVGYAQGMTVRIFITLGLYLASFSWSLGAWLTLRTLRWKEEVYRRDDSPRLGHRGPLDSGLR